MHPPRHVPPAFVPGAPLTCSTDNRRRSRAARPARAPDPGRARHAKLHGRELGACANCGRTVYLEHNFTRFDGRVVHVRCPIART